MPVPVCVRVAVFEEVEEKLVDGVGDGVGVLLAVGEDVRVADAVNVLEAEQAYPPKYTGLSDMSFR